MGVKKIKVGHAGTLDPLADGLLILCTGKKTKTIEQIMGLEKIYSGIIRLGNSTPSYDLETKFDETFATNHISEDQIRGIAEQMTGEQNQLPPIFSAKKVNGKRAYDYARKGEEVVLQPKQILITQFDITAVEGLDIHFLIRCSKGTYIRSIAHDFGKKLGSGSHLAALRREGIGTYNLTASKNVEEWIEIIETAELYEEQSN